MKDSMRGSKSNFNKLTVSTKKLGKSISRDSSLN